jgi:glycosyltransferase involved in cell wall biosynthesis
MSNIKILHVLTSTVGGAGIHVYHLSHYINKQKYVPVVAFTPGQHLDYRFYENDIEVLPLRMGRRAYLTRLAADCHQLYQYIRANKVHIVHTHNTLAGLVGRLAAKLAGVPVAIHMIHTFAAHPHVSSGTRILFQQVERSWDRLTTHYVAGSEYIHQQAIKRGIAAPNKITTIHYAIETEQFTRTDSSPDCLSMRRQALNLSATDRVIGFIGRLEEQKGPAIFVEAVSQVAKQIENLHVLIVGDGELRESLEKQAEQLGIDHHIHFLGWQRDIPELLSVMDVFCLASLWEAFGIVFAEAGLMQCPVVATNVEGIPEVVVNGKSGILVEPYNSSALASALIHILENQELAVEMGRHGREYILSNFSVEKMVTAHEELYDSLLAENH